MVLHPADVASPGVLTNVPPFGVRDVPIVELVISVNRPLSRSGGMVDAGRDDRGVPEDEGGGGMSVLSTLVPFRLGLGATESA